MWITPKLHYTIAMHTPLLQGDMPTVAVIRHSEDRANVIKVGETRGRDFHKHSMAFISELAKKCADIDKTAEIYAHLVFSGRAYGPREIAQLIHGRWRDESYSVVTVKLGGDRARLESDDERLPMNHFTLPRLTMINCLNMAYAEPGKIYMSLEPEDVADLDKQIAAFSERTATIPANDPEAIMEYDGEGLVIAMGVAVWHHLNAKTVRAGWAREYMEERI